MGEEKRHAHNGGGQHICNESSVLHPPSSILYPLSSSPIGLLAGSGRFPVVFAEKARSLRIPVVCVGLRHEAAPELAGLVQRFYWAGVAQLGRMIRCFKREGVQRLVMAGKVKKAAFMHKPWRVLSLLPDWRMIRFWYRRSRRSFWQYRRVSFRSPRAIC